MFVESQSGVQGKHVYSFCLLPVCRAYVNLLFCIPQQLFGKGLFKPPSGLVIQCKFCSGTTTVTDFDSSNCERARVDTSAGNEMFRRMLGLAVRS